MKKKSKIEDKVYFVITGASKGLGKALVEELAQNKLYQLLAVSRNEKLLKELVESSSHNNVDYIAADLTFQNDIKMVEQFVSKNWPRVDTLINNAGHLVNKPFRKMTEEDFNRTSGVNFKVPYFLSQQLIPALLKSDKAHIVNIGSMGGVAGVSKFPGLSVYSSSKGALTILTECLAEELKEEGIRVNCLSLGSVQTEMLNEAFPGMDAHSSPREMAKLISEIVTTTSQIINGKNLLLAGVGI